MFTPFRGIQTKYQWLGVGGKRILGIIDRLSASLLKAKEEIFVIVVLENETLSKGGRVKGRQFYGCDYYLYIAGVAKEMIPNRAKQNRPHQSTSRWAPRSLHARSTGFIFIYHLGLVDKGRGAASSVHAEAAFVLANHSAEGMVMFQETVVIKTRRPPFVSTHQSPQTRLIIHDLNLQVTKLLLCKWSNWAI